MGGWGQHTIGLPGVEPTAGRRLTRLGLIFLLLAGLLVLLELIGGLRGTVHYLSVSGITARCRRWETAYYLVGGVVAPVVATLVLLDFLRTGMTWPKRLALVGFLGSVLGAMATLLLFPYSF